MYISWLFLYTFETWEGYICLNIDIFISLGLHMCFIGCGCSNMALQMMSLAPLVGISLIWSKNHFVQYVYFCISPKICFQYHEFHRYCKPYNMYIPLWLLYNISCIHAFICLHLIFLHIFCWGMLGVYCGCRDMAWQIKPSHIWLKFTVLFLSNGYHARDLTLYEIDIYVRCLSTSTFFSIFYHIWVYNMMSIIHL